MFAIQSFVIKHFAWPTCYSIFNYICVDESEDEDEGLMRETMKRETQLLVDSKTKKKPQDDDEEEESKGKQKRR